METVGSITTNCTSQYLSNTNESVLCQLEPNLSFERINGMEHPVGHIDKSLSHESNNKPEKIDEFEKLMEMVFEVGLLTIVGIAGMIGNFAAIVLFSRYIVLFMYMYSFDLSVVIRYFSYHLKFYLTFFSRLRVQLKFHRLMIMLCIYDTVYVLLNILLFALPKMLKTYEASGYHYFVLPKAIPFGMTKYHHLNLFDNLCMTMSSYMCVVTVNIL